MHLSLTNSMHSSTFVHYLFINQWLAVMTDRTPRYAGLSYEDLMLLPLARALHAISSDPRLGHVYFSLQVGCGTQDTPLGYCTS
jgi:hypothetical protein